MKNENITSPLTELDQLLKILNSDIKKGISTYEWRKKIQIFGKNIIPEKKQNNLYKIILFQLLNSTTILLLVSIIISYSIGEWINGHAVLAVLIINMLIGVFMEYKADRSIRALKKLLQPKARVIRDGINQEINSIDIVPGDIIQVEAGDIIPADARIINSNELHVNESGLTGESMPVRKNNTLDSDHKTNYFKNIFLYKSTAVVNGKATAIVISTGIQTEIGKVAKSIESIITESSPLDKKIRVFTKKIIRITLLLIFIIAVFGVLRKKEIYELFETAVSLAVASIPEGLPVAATLTLSYGMLRLAKHNVIVNKLSAVETLGNTTVICTDKTGTLTENKIAVAKIISSSENINSSEKFKNSIEIDLIMKISALCNNSNLNISNKKNIEVGDPLDLAILKFSNDINFNYSEIKTSFPRISEIPFSSENKLMITEHKADSSFLICIKGAFENVIRYCNKIQHMGATNEFSKSDYDLWTTNEKKLAQEGLRVLAVAYKNSDHSEINSITGFIFLGLMGFADPPVKEIEREIRICKEAGIRVVMISGDHPETTKYIGKKIGILDEDDFVICGSELENSSKDKIDKCNAFARVTPIEKFNIVNRFREAGNIVAMTGDGINDAPALKRADVGIAMGLRGTDIAKESAGIILKDDSFKSIVYSIYQGRLIYENIQKFIVYLLSCNFAELMVIFIIYLLNLPLNISPIQILFMNLVTDVFPALALGFSEGEKDIMKRSPLPPEKALIDKKLWIQIIIYSGIMAIFSLIILLLTKLNLFTTIYQNHGMLNNLVFLSLVLCQLIHVFNIKLNQNDSYLLINLKNKYIWIAISTCIVILIFSIFNNTLSQLIFNYKLSSEEFIIPLFISILYFICIRMINRFI